MKQPAFKAITAQWIKGLCDLDCDTQLIKS